MAKVINSNWLENTVAGENWTRPKQNEVQMIFYCNDESRQANFDLPLSLQFDETEPRCYRAYILNNFGEYNAEKVFRMIENTIRN